MQIPLLRCQAPACLLELRHAVDGSRRRAQGLLLEGSSQRAWRRELEQLLDILFAGQTGAGSEARLPQWQDGRGQQQL